jgi:hypothetical protein
MRDLSGHRYVSPYDFAIVQIGAGEVDSAFEWLEKALEERSLWLGYLNVEPQFDPLCRDARFQHLRTAVGLT